MKEKIMLFRVERNKLYKNTAEIFMKLKKIITAKYYATPEAKKTFKKWLVMKELTMEKFSKKCGCSAAYISYVINGKKPVNTRTIALFKKGGYDLL